MSGSGSGSGGYSKIRPAGTSCHKSRSMDFSDFFAFPQTPKLNNSSSNRNKTTDTIPEQEEEEPSKQQEEEEEDQVKNTKAATLKKNKNKNSSSSPPQTVRDAAAAGGKVERFGVILGRSGSVSSSSGFQASMKRAFSLRRSSSVSERYCRIHDQYMAIASPTTEETRTCINKKKHTGSAKIFKACKRILGL